MKSYQKILAVIALSGMCMATAMASEGEVSAKKSKKHHAEKTEEKAPCEACEAIKRLEEKVAAQQSEIDQLKGVQPVAPGTTDAAAQAAAAEAKQAADAAAAAAAEANAKAAAAQADIASMKNEVNSAAEEAQKAQKEVGELEKPSYIHYKNIQFIPGGFLAAESVWRQHAEQTDVLSNNFAKIPTPNNTNYDLTEWRATGRQSRLSFKAIGNVGDVKLLGYYEMDFLGAAPTANENQSNSFNIRQRQLYADAEWHGWGVAAGQMWTLNNLTKKGAAPYAFWNPATIDAQYVAGFTFARQTGFRVYKELNGGKETVAFAIENAAILAPAGACPTGDTCTYGAAGVASLGNINGTFTDSLAPDLIAKVAFDPSFGHFEIRGVGRFFRDRVSVNSSSTAGNNETTVGGGIAAGAIVPVMNKKVNLIAQGLVGRGTARYGDSGVVDVVIRPDGSLGPVKNLQALGGIEWQATPKLQVYGYTGDEYWGRDLYAGAGYGTGSNQRNLIQGVFGMWYNIYKGGYGTLATGAQYSYTHVANWGGSQANENMAFTSLRYYIP
jgi:hypothetical protein